MPHTLSIRDDAGHWKKLSEPYSDYRSAVLDGQLLGGYGRFLVDSPYIPTSDEQLLRKGRSAKDVFLTTL